MKKILLLVSCIISLTANAQSIINISTGVSNATGQVMPNLSQDDTWKVYRPGNTTAITPVVLQTVSGWTNPTCARWISPSAGNQPAGDYSYETFFQIPCSATNPSLILDVYACDNTFLEIHINNHIIPFVSGNVDDNNLRFNFAVPNLAPYVVVGTNTLQILVHNRPVGGGTSGTMSGLLICGKINTNAVYNNNPAFTLFQPQVSNQTHFYRAATPVVTNANLVPGFGEMYIIECISFDEQTVFSRTSQGSNPNPPCWWLYPNSVSFRGYNGTQDVTNISPCKLNGIGKFWQCSKYRITRGTWNSYCPWAQHWIITVGDSCNQFTANGPEPLYKIDTHAPDFSYLKPSNAPAPANSVQQPIAGSLVSPNPGNGVFVIKTGFINSGSVEIYNEAGVRIRQIVLNNNKGNTNIDLSGQPAGMYTARIITNKEVLTERIVLVK